MKFKYKDQVVINTEFFQGHWGMVTDAYPFYNYNTATRASEISGYQYTVTLHDGKVRTFEENELTPVGQFSGTITQQLQYPNQYYGFSTTIPSYDYRGIPIPNSGTISIPLTSGINIENK